MTCIQHGDHSDDYCGPECDRLTKFWARCHRAPYKFTGRVGDTYYWTRRDPHRQAMDEVVSCNVAWFWGGAA